MEQLQETSGCGRWRMAGLIVTSALLLAGCESQSPLAYQASPPAVSAPTTGEIPPEPVIEARDKVKEGRMGLCQRELASLNTISPRAYAVRKAHFDNLVKTAGVYTAVRGDVNSLTQDTVDALYKYKTNQLCAEIERDVLNGLIRKGESLK